MLSQRADVGPTAGTPGGVLRRKRAGRLLLLLCAASFLLSLLLGVSYWTSRRRALMEARSKAEGEAVRAAKVIDSELSRLPVVVRAVAEDLSSGRVGKSALDERLKRAVDTAPQIFGIGAAYAPRAYDPELRLHAPYYRRRDGPTELIQLDSLYDYTEGNHEWYATPLKSGPSWSEPAITDESPAPLVKFSAPFTQTLPDGSRGTAGVIHGTMSLSEIDALIRSLDLGEYGYGFLISRKGFVISHPFADQYAGGVAVFESDSKSDAARRMFDATRGHAKEVVVDAIDPVTGEPSWVFTEPVPSTGWTVGVVFFNKEITHDVGFRRHEIRLTLAGLLLACLLLATFLRTRYQGEMRILWIGIASASTLLVAAIGLLWWEGYGTSVAESPGDTPLVNAASVQKFVFATTRDALARGRNLPLYIPTGVFLQTLEIVGPNNINVTGYVWQNYARSVPPTVVRGFALPDASNSEITEAYRRSDSDGETIGWHVKATLRQRFDYTRYPLDQQGFRLSIRHRELDNRVILIPDLESYKIIHPLARFGLEKDLTLPGWIIERTQFSNRMKARNTTFGITSNSDGSVNELNFNIILNRQIIEPMFSNLLPLAICAFMLFALLLVVKESTRTNVVQILAAHSALFFVVILSELDLRRRLSASSILYIEYFYFVMYGAILSVALITLTNAWSGHFPRIEKREHLLPKLLFWPVVLFALLTITLFILY